MQRQKIYKAFELLDRTLEAIIVIAFATMLIVGGLQVFNRSFLKTSLDWSDELQRYLHIWIVFLAIPLGYKHKNHIGMNIFFDRLPKILQEIVGLVIHIMWFALGILIVIFSKKIISVASNQTSPGLGIKMSWPYLCMVLGGGYMSLLGLKNIWSKINSLIIKNKQGEKAC